MKYFVQPEGSAKVPASVQLNGAWVVVANTVVSTLVGTVVESVVAAVVGTVVGTVVGSVVGRVVAGQFPNMQPGTLLSK